MAVLSFDAEYQRARHRPPFSNGFEGETWMSLWCEDGCTHYDDCPLLLVAMLDRTPQAWTEREPLGLNRYTCTEYAEESAL